MPLDVKFPPIVSRFVQSNARHRYIVGPFGSGKTVGSLVDIPRRAAMQRPSTENGKRKSRWAVVRNTVPELRETTMKSWFDWFPSGGLGHYMSTTKTYHIKNGDIEAEVIFCALDDDGDVKKLLGMELTGANLAEFREIPRAIVEALDGRIGRYPRMNEGGPTWVGMWGDSNAPEEGSYWYAKMEGLNPDDLKKKQPTDWEIFRQPGAMIEHSEGEGEKRRKYYTLNPDAENLCNLPVGYYENLIKDKSEDFIRVNVLAQYGRSKGGLPVHPEFDRRIHIANQALIPSRELILLVCADFGLTPALALKQQDAFGRVLTLDDITCFDMGLERAIETKLLPLLNKKYKGGAKNGEYEVIVTGDPSGDTRAQGNEVSCVDIFRGYKKHLGKVKMASTNAAAARRGGTDHFLVNKLTPTYLVDPGCDSTIAAMSGGFKFKKHKDGRHSEDIEKDDFSHIGEANEYGDLYFKEGRRRKAEQRADQLDWAAQYRAQVQTGNAYNSPR
jgi:hypothetical protein